MPSSSAMIPSLSSTRRLVSRSTHTTFGTNIPSSIRYGKSMSSIKVMMKMRTTMMIVIVIAILMMMMMMMMSSSKTTTTIIDSGMMDYPATLIGMAVVEAYRGPALCPTKRRTWWFKTSPAYNTDPVDGVVVFTSSELDDNKNNNDISSSRRSYITSIQDHHHHHHQPPLSLVQQQEQPQQQQQEQQQQKQQEYRQVMEALPSPLMDAQGHLIDSPQALVQLVSSRRVALYFAGSPCKNNNGDDHNHHHYDYDYGMYGSNNNNNDVYDYDNNNFIDHDYDDGGYHHQQHHDDEEEDTSCCVIIDPATSVDEIEFMLPQYREALQQTNQDIQLIYVPSCDDTIETQMERMQELGLELGVPIGPTSDALKLKFAIWSASESEKFVTTSSTTTTTTTTTTSSDNTSSSSSSSSPTTTTSLSSSSTQAGTPSPNHHNHHEHNQQQQHGLSSLSSSSLSSYQQQQHNQQQQQQQRKQLQNGRRRRRSGVPAFVVLNTNGEELAFLNTKEHSIQALAEWPLDDPKGIW